MSALFREFPAKQAPFTVIFFNGRPFRALPFTYESSRPGQGFSPRPGLFVFSSAQINKAEGLTNFAKSRRRLAGRDLKFKICGQDRINSAGFGILSDTKTPSRGKRMLRDFVRTSVYLAALALLFPRSALAYIDPGVGSLILQGLAAAAISVLVFWSNLRIKIKDFFTGHGAKTENGASADLDKRS